MKLQWFVSSCLLLLVASGVVGQNVETSTTLVPSTSGAPSTTPTFPSTTQTPTTQATPTPTPKPGVPVWTVPDVKGGVCIMLALDADLIVFYNDTKNTLLNKSISIPADAVSSGSCDQESIVLTFRHPARGATFVLNITFSQNEANYKVSLLQLAYDLSNITFPKVAAANSSVEASLTDVPSFLQDINIKNSIKCADNKELQLSGSNSQVTLHIVDVQVQAFMTGTEFGEAADCVMKRNSDIVPIAVGCALAALVIIVLVAYLIGRRRSRQAGYQSV